MTLRRRVAFATIGGVLLCAPLPRADATFVIFSQYYEGGSGSNHLLELWNTTLFTIDFTTAQPLILDNFTNGSSSVTSSLSLSGFSIPAGAVVVIANTDSAGDTAIGASGFADGGFNFIDTPSTMMDFSGDDALRVKTDGATRDILGQIGFDPGTSWSGGGVSTANQNIGLTLTAAATGDTNGSDAYDPSVRMQTISSTASITAASMSGLGIRRDGLVWDNDGAGQAAGGNGTWNLSATRWTANNTSATPTYVAWNNSSSVARHVTFLGTAGTVNVDANVTVTGMTFHSSGYVISATAGRSLTLGAEQTIFNVNAAAHTATISAPIGGVAENLFEKTGPGKLILSGNNSYAGITYVERGTLLVNGTHSGGGLYYVGGGATLGGTGKVAKTFVDDFGTLAPGTSIGVLEVQGDLEFDNLAVLRIELDVDGVGGADSADKILVSGADRQVNLGGAKLQFVFTPAVLATFGTPKTFVIIDNQQSTSDVVGSFDGITMAMPVVSGLLKYKVYVGGTNNNDVLVDFTAVPEPPALSVLAIAYALRARRRACER